MNNLLGGSRSMDVGERSAVGRNFIMKPCPPIAFAEPGKTSEVVTPPAILSAYASSCVLSPSRERSQGCVIPCLELPSLAPRREGDESTAR